MRKKSADEAATPREAPRARVFHYLERVIASGDIPQGGAIPSERALASLLGVSQNTAAAAVDEAEACGLVVRRAGTHRRFAGVIRGKSLVSSTVYVLANMNYFSDIATAPGWSDEFLALDVVQRLSFMGRHVSFLNTKSLPDGGLDAIFEARPGAMVVTSSVTGDPMALKTLKRCREAGIPAVAYGNAPELRSFDRVYTDHRAGSRELTRWLLAHGRRRIVPFFPFSPKRFWETERIAGYKAAMREAGLEPLPCTVFDAPAVGSDYTPDNYRIHVAMALSALVALRREGGYPDALLCRDDDWASSAITAIRDLGLIPNRDILVAGYDNMVRAPDESRYEDIRPAVTVDKLNGQTSEDLAALVVARMEGELPPEPQARIHAHQLVILDPEFR